MTTYTFTGAVAYDRLGSSWRTAAGLRSVSVTDPATGILPTNLVQGGVAVSWLTADANSRYSFTCDVPGVVVDFGAGAEALYANEVPNMAIAAGGATTASIDARMKWAPLTPYTLGQQILSPNNDVVSAIAAHTSGASFTPANWSLSSTYLPQSQKDAVSGVASLSATGAVLSAVPSGSVGVGMGSLLVDASATSTAVGAHSLASNTTGQSCNAFGDEALQYNTTGNNNCAFGTVALQLNVTGHDNCAFGDTALGANTGSTNSAFGSNTLAGHTTGSNNTAVGSSAIGNDSIVGATSVGNTAVGATAMTSNLSGNNNSALGLAALFTNTAGVSNVAVGMNALFAATSNSNTAVGAGALQAQVGGIWNVALGANSGYAPAGVTANATVNGSGDTWLGYGTGPGNATDPTYATAIGYKATCIGNGSVAIGTDSGGAGAASTASNLITLGTTNHTTKIPGTPAFVTGDLYLVVDSVGRIHKSALGPAS